MRRYKVNMSGYDIGQWEYQTVEAMARRYNANRRRADVLSELQSGVHGEQREVMIWEVGLVERAARETADGEWQRALMLVCCDGWRYEDVETSLMPTNNRNAFFRARREFYWRLWGLLQAELGRMVAGES